MRGVCMKVARIPLKQQEVASPLKGERKGTRVNKMVNWCDEKCEIFDAWWSEGFTETVARPLHGRPMGCNSKIGQFFELRCKGTMNILGFANFFGEKCKKCGILMIFGGKIVNYWNG